MSDIVRFSKYDRELLDVISKLEHDIQDVLNSDLKLNFYHASYTDSEIVTQALVCYRNSLIYQLNDIKKKLPPEV